MQRNKIYGVRMRWAVLLGCAVALSATCARAADTRTPDGTIELSEGSVGVGIGYSWGSGTLTYKGKQHKFKVEGLSAGDVGARSVSAKGNVYDLKKLEDFNGTYTAATAGATVGGGGAAAIMKNQNGVEMTVMATTQGIGLTLGAQGVKVNLEK
jgi:hypothetical protein